jgi:hypothetical protein
LDYHRRLVELNEFLTDKSSDAYSKYVDRLLARPEFGEHWARMWLDLARYADSAGYADDRPRTIWGYRDYVIRAFNNNLPFDQFTIEQLAGDLLPNPSQEQLVATAFHRNTQTNNEGGTNDEEFRNVAVVDRVNTTFAPGWGRPWHVPSAIHINTIRLLIMNIFRFLMSLIRRKMPIEEMKAQSWN